MMKWILFGCLFFTGPVLALDKASPLEIAVELSAGNFTDGQPTLKVRLTNQGHEKITIEKSALPWGNRYSITLLAIPQSSHYEQPLSLVFPIDDLLPEDIDIKPGETLNGSIRLDLVFKDIGAVLQQKPLLILWRYRLRTVDGKQLEPLTGSVSLPQIASSKSAGK